MCPQWCRSCSAQNNSPPICSDCTLPSQLSPAGTCFLCHPICATCSLSPNNCTTCPKDLVLEIIEETGNCVDIPSCPFSNCAKCSRDALNEIYCEQCLPGFFSFSFGCSPCRYPCSSCSFNASDVWDTTI
jgi:hypothetical protein